jgi:DNA polymerase-1
MAMINIAKRLKKENLRTKMLLQVHDELVFEVPQEELNSATKLVKDEMEGVYPLNIPLKVDISWGNNWDEAH